MKRTALRRPLPILPKRRDFVTVPPFSRARHASIFAVTLVDLFRRISSGWAGNGSRLHRAERLSSECNSLKSHERYFRRARRGRERQVLVNDGVQEFVDKKRVVKSQKAPPPYPVWSNISSKGDLFYEFMLRSTSIIFLSTGALFLLAVERAHGHNWMESASREVGKASTTKPFKQRSQSDTHAQLGPGQRMAVKFATGHNKFHYFALFSSQDQGYAYFDSYLDMVKDYIGSAPSSANVADIRAFLQPRHLTHVIYNQLKIHDSIDAKKKGGGWAVLIEHIFALTRAHTRIGHIP
eukprot:jgi/Bigna1/76183/fgenesh1_pg.39_\